MRHEFLPSRVAPELCEECGFNIHAKTHVSSSVGVDKVDESLYEDDLDHEGHWFEIWGED